MKLISFTILAFTYFLAGNNVVAQITITEETLPGVGSRIESHVSAERIEVDFGSAGSNQTWDVSGYSCTLPLVDEYIDPASTTYGGIFPTATHCKRHTLGNGYTLGYFQLLNGQLLDLGSASFIEGFDSSYYPWDLVPLLMPLPLTFESSWTSLSQRYMEVFPGFGLTTRDSSVSSIDGWGIIETGNGTYSVLRQFTQAWQRSWMTGEPADSVLSCSYSWIDVHGNTICSMSFTGLVPGQSLAWVIRADLIQYVPVSHRADIISDFAISQNYPNPFNSSTQIQYYLPQLANVKLRVFDVLGREVATLVNGEMQPLGQHVVSWNGLNNAGIGVATGTYVYRIEAGEFRNEKKMVLVK